VFSSSCSADPRSSAPSSGRSSWIGVANPCAGQLCSIGSISVVSLGVVK